MSKYSIYSLEKRLVLLIFSRIHYTDKFISSVDITLMTEISKTERAPRILLPLKAVHMRCDIKQKVPDMVSVKNKHEKLRVVTFL